MKKQREEIDIKGIWRPGIFQNFSDAIVCGSSTFLFNESLGFDRRIPVLSPIFKRPDRFSLPIEEKRRASKFLLYLLKSIAPWVDPHRTVYGNLTHGNKIVFVDKDFMELSLWSKINRTLNTDGLITNLPGVPLLITGKDCTPILMFDPDKKAIGVLHSGWKGTAKKIAIKGLEEMVKKYGSVPKDILISLGPSIAQNDFEVEEDVLCEYGKVFSSKEIDKIFKRKNAKKFLLDPISAIKIQLLNAGALKKNIEVSKFTTTGDNNLFSSARLAGGASKVDSIFFILCLK